MSANVPALGNVARYHRFLASAIYGGPVLLATSLLVYRAFDNGWPALVQIAFAVFVLLIGLATGRRALRLGIEVVPSGIVVVNVLKTEHLRWNDLADFEIHRDRGLWTSVTVVLRDGRLISVDGLRVWGGDPKLLIPDLEGLRAVLHSAEQSG